MGFRRNRSQQAEVIQAMCKIGPFLIFFLKLQSEKKIIGDPDITDSTEIVTVVNKLREPYISKPH